MYWLGFYGTKTVFGGLTVASGAPVFTKEFETPFHVMPDFIRVIDGGTYVLFIYAYETLGHMFKFDPNFNQV